MLLWMVKLGKPLCNKNLIDYFPMKTIIKTMVYRQPKQQQQTGYILVEVLVTVAILAVGILGIAAVQISSLTLIQSSIERGEAAILVSSLTNQMRANRADNMVHYHGKELAASATELGIGGDLDCDDAFAVTGNRLTSGTESGPTRQQRVALRLDERAKHDIALWSRNAWCLAFPTSNPSGSIICGATGVGPDGERISSTTIAGTGPHFTQCIVEMSWDNARSKRLLYDGPDPNSYTPLRQRHVANIIF